MSCTPCLKPASFIAVAKRLRYVETLGPTNALRATVEKRSYSRYSGITSLEIDWYASGNSSVMISDTRCSCALLRYECRKQTAIASTPDSLSRRTSRRTASSSSGVTISPCGAVTRSATTRRWRRLTSGRACHGRSCWIEKLSGFLWRAMWRMSRKPSVVIRPTEAPWCVSAMLVATVVPCRRLSISDSCTPPFSQRRLMPSTTPRAGSSGVDGTLSTVILPASSSTRIRSVKVPPTSTPMRFTVAALLRPRCRKGSSCCESIQCIHWIANDRFRPQPCTIARHERQG